jgi:hypothetical protein
MGVALLVYCVDVRPFAVYGDPSPAARELLDGFGATAPGGFLARFR